MDIALYGSHASRSSSSLEIEFWQTTTGPSSFDPFGALVKWVEHGVAPDRIIGSHLTNGVVDRTRPLCPYPQEAIYKGSGSIDDAANFVCRVRHVRDTVNSDFYRRDREEDDE